MKTKKRKKESMKQTAKNWFSMPTQGFYTHPVLHLDCKGYLEIENCKKVLLYTETEVRLDMGVQTIAIYGNNLCFAQLAGKNLYLKGQVFELKLFEPSSEGGK